MVLKLEAFPCPSYVLSNLIFLQLICAAFAIEFTSSVSIYLDKNVYIQLHCEHLSGTETQSHPKLEEWPFPQLPVF